MTPQNVLTQIIYAMLSGAQPKDAVMDDSQFTAAVSVVNAFNDVTDEALIKTADYVLKNAQTSGNSYRMVWYSRQEAVLK